MRRLLSCALVLAACAPTREPSVPDAIDAGTSDAGTPPPTCARSDAMTPGPAAIVDGALRMDATAIATSACTRRYTLRTNQALRDALPNNPRLVDERADRPTIRTGNTAFDGLYALALDELREASVDAISDPAFNGGQPIACPPGGCFETGRLWKYVWTRDVSFSAHLALAALDPIRTRNSLVFKLSALRTGGGTEIVQDTGSGGSWPVSTDRVAWALGARELLKYLEGADRTAFRDQAAEALRHTLERDRATIYDLRDGLYTGETSFLDWREQTYPAWMATDPAQIAATKALSTNALHASAMELLADLSAEQGDSATSTLWRSRAAELRLKARAAFALPARKLFTSFLHPTLAPAAADHHDLLGHAFAILEGVADDAQAGAALSNFPHLAAGAPVVWPQQQRTPIYHNRSVWPFTQAYWAKAAKRAGSDAAVTHAANALVRAAALNLSNMENLELVSGAPFLHDGPNSGPVVNSQRQLWSVAGFLSLVQDVVFGLEATNDGLRFSPFLTRDLRRTLFAATDVLTLADFPYRGRHVTVVVHLPPLTDAQGGVFEVASRTLDGQPIDDATLLTPVLLKDRSLLEITLKEGTRVPSTITRLTDTSDFRTLFGPREPSIDALTTRDDHPVLALSAGGENPSEVVFDVYRDGALAQAGIAGAAVEWLDPEIRATDATSTCWSLVSRFKSTNTASHHSRPTCHWGRNFERIVTLSARDFMQVGGTTAVSEGRFHTENWGDPNDTLSVLVRAIATGPHVLQLVGSNGAGPVSTGVACGVKRVEVREVDGDRLVASGIVALPQTGSWADERDSTSLRADLVAGRAYRITVKHDAITANMSLFDHFAKYTPGPTIQGGNSGAFTRVNVAGVKLLALSGYPTAPARKLLFDGDHDFDKFAATQQLTPAQPFESWDRFALDWEADDLYLASVVSGFATNPSLPVIVYLQAGTSLLAPAATRAGLEYGGQTPTIPFPATHAIVLRRTSELGADGPWNGLFEWDGERWARRLRFQEGRDFWANRDGVTLSARVPRGLLGSPSHLRLCAHVAAGDAWKDLVPSAHRPAEAVTTGFYELELAADTRASRWSLR